MRYDGFISYSHAADGELAPALQRALQRMAKPWYRRRSLEVFRDETGLSVDPHLWGAIVAALDDSEWFLLLTSPQAAASEWVNREIEHWKSHRSVDKILPVLTEGHWEWDAAAGDFTANSDAVPPALRGVFTDEPRHLDLRWARQEKQVDLHNSRFRNAVAELAAPLHGRSKDEIEGEDVRQHRRTVRITWAATIALALLTVAALVGAGVAVRNAQHAEQRRIQAEAQRLAAQSQSELERPDLAFLLAAHGYRLDPGVRTQSALLTAVANHPEIKMRIGADAPVTAVATSAASDRVWIGTADGGLTVHRFSDGAELARADELFAREVVAMYPGGAGSDTVVATDGAVVLTLDADLALRQTRTPGQAVQSLAVEAKTGRVAAGTGDGHVIVWEPGQSEPTETLTASGAVADGEFSWVTALAWTPDGGLIAASADGSFRRFDPGAADAPVWEQRDAAAPGGWVSAIAVVADGTVVTGATDGTVGFWSGGDGALTDAGLTALHLDSVTALAATGDPAESGSVASVSDDGSLVYWNHLSGAQPLAPLRVDEQAVTAVAWDPANPAHGVTGGRAGGVVLLDYGDDARRPLARPVEGWTRAVAVALAPEGDRLAVVRDDGASTSQLVLTGADQPDPNSRSVPVDGTVEQLALTPDGNLALAGTGDGAVAVWDGTAGATTVTEVAPGQVVSRLAVAADGTTVATGAQHLDDTSGGPATVQLWRLEGRELLAQHQIEAPRFGYGLAFTPDGTALVIGGAGEFLIHPIDAGEPVRVDLGDDWTRSLAVSPDGATVAVGLGSGPVRLFDVRTGETTGDDLRVAARVTDLAFGADGTQLVTVSQDGSFIVWDVAGRSRLSDRALTVAGPGAAATGRLQTSLGLAPDRAVTATAADGLLVQWSLSPEDWIAEGCRVHRRDLTAAEQDRYDLQGAPPICAP